MRSASAPASQHRAFVESIPGARAVGMHGSWNRFQVWQILEGRLWNRFQRLARTEWLPRSPQDERDHPMGRPRKSVRRSDHGVGSSQRLRAVHPRYGLWRVACCNPSKGPSVIVPVARPSVAAVLPLMPRDEEDGEPAQRQRLSRGRARPCRQSAGSAAPARGGVDRGTCGR